MPQRAQCASGQGAQYASVNQYAPVSTTRLSEPNVSVSPIRVSEYPFALPFSSGTTTTEHAVCQKIVMFLTIEDERR